MARTQEALHDQTLDDLLATIPKARKVRTTLKQDAAHAEPQQQLSLHVGTEADRDAVLIPRDSIEPSLLNARRHFAPDALKELGESFKADGQLQSIIVRPHPRKEGKYEICVGERRWRAADPRYGDLAMLRCRVGNYSDAEVRALSLKENIKRENLRPTEIAQGLQELRDDVKAPLQWAEIASQIGKTRQWVNDYVSLLKMAPFVQSAVDEGKLTIYQAVPMRQLDHPQQVKAAQLAIRDNMTTRQIEDGVRAVLGKAKPLKEPTQPQGQVLHFPTTPRPSIEGTGFAVPADSAIERHHATVMQSTPITGGHTQGTYAPRQPQIDPVDLMLKVCNGAQAVAAALPSLMNREHLYKSELRTLVAQTRAALDEIERVGQGRQ